MNFEAHYIEALENTTPVAIQRVARKALELLQQGHGVVSAACSHQALEGLSQVDLAKALQEAAQSLSLQNQTPTADPETWQRRVSLANEHVQQIVIPLPHDKILKINLRLSENLPLASGMLVARGGLCDEVPGKNGIGALTAGLMCRGTKQQTYRKFVEELEDNAASITSFSGRDVFGMRFDALSDKALRTTQMLLDCLFEPALATSEWENVHAETREMLVAQKDSPMVHLSRLIQTALFPDHPYAQPSLGTEASIAGLCLPDAQQYWENIFRAQEFIVSLAGKIPVQQITHRIASAFQEHLSKRSADAPRTYPKAPLPPHPSHMSFAFHELNREQSHLALAFRAFCIDDPRKTALEIACHILAGQGGRLFLDLRDTRSLAYTVHASQMPGLYGGHLTAYIATAHHKLEEALTGLKHHMAAFAKTPPTLEECDRAKQSVLGSQMIDSQHRFYQASQLAMSDVYGLGFDHVLFLEERVRKVTPEAVQQAWQDMLNQSTPVVALVGPAESRQRLSDFCSKGLAFG